MTRYHICNDYSLEEMKPEETIDESKYNLLPFKGGTLYADKKNNEKHYFVINKPRLTGQYLH